MKVNYQKRMEEQIAALPPSEGKPLLLLHACCAPCSSAVLEVLTAHFNINLYFYNPNIHPVEEYQKRFGELSRLVEAMGLKETVRILPVTYQPEDFFAAAKWLLE